MKYQSIENYGVIGDLETVALVGINGSIDFMCFPNFDSPTVFAALLDQEKGGFFQISCIEDNIKNKQLYLPDTNILLTRFHYEKGMGELTDLMPIASIIKKNVLIRKVKNIKGTSKYRMHCCPRFNYAKSSHKAALNKNEIIFTSEGENRLVLKLRSSIPLKLIKGDAFAEFTLKAGESAEFVLENLEEGALPPEPLENFVEKALDRTFNYWKNWAAKSTYTGRWREIVIRSALALKLLTFEKYGSIIAAPTFGLPEKIGGQKNWDYRYVWIRDAAFTVYSLLSIGFKKEAEFFLQWIQRLFENLHQRLILKPLYRIDGTEIVDESTLSNFSGYMNSSPVLIGNAAGGQIQMDIYGEFMDSIYLCEKYVIPLSNQIWTHIVKEIDWLEKNWRNKGSGIWEIRGESKHFLYSRFMCWVAFDRAIKIARKRSFPFSSSWIKARDEIYYSIYKNFWSSRYKSFMQSEKGSEVDASTLLMPLKRFISPKDPQWLSTLKKIEKDLTVDSIVYRYKPAEAKLFGLKPGEGTFSACSFWYIECLSRSGQVQKAEILFDKMLSYANHLGLYSEQLGIQGEALGNFPQALTHLSLISAACDISKRLK